MSSAIVAAQRRRDCLLASTVLGPILSLGIAAAKAQQSTSNPLPAIEISSPEDQTRTRAKPITDEGSGSRRVAPKISQTTTPNIAPAPGPDGSPASGAAAVRQFNGIVGASTSVITSEDIANHQHKHRASARPERIAREWRSGCQAVQRHRRRLRHRHHVRRYRALSGSNRAGNHRPDARRTAEELVRGREWRRDRGRPAWIWCFCQFEHSRPHERPQAQ